MCSSDLCMMLPFVLLLAAMALGALLFDQWWSRHYCKTVLALGAVPVGYYLFSLPLSAALLVANGFANTASNFWYTLCKIVIHESQASSIHFTMNPYETVINKFLSY